METLKIEDLSKEQPLRFITRQYTYLDSKPEEHFETLRKKIIDEENFQAALDK